MRQKGQLFMAVCCNQLITRFNHDGPGCETGQIEFYRIRRLEFGNTVKLNKIRICLTLHILHAMCQVLTC